MNKKTVKALKIAGVIVIASTVIILGVFYFAIEGVASGPV